jgi:HEAT repeat protein
MADDQYTGRTLDAMNARGLAGKRDYVRSLEQRRDEEAMSLLVECLCDESWYLRELAESALLRMGDRAGETLVPLLEQGLWFSRASAARVLGRLGYRPAAPALLQLLEDSVETVADSAESALADLAHRGGSVRIAWELHRAEPGTRQALLARLAQRHRALGERLLRMLRNDELMNSEQPDELRDDSELVRASEEGVEWEVLTGPPGAKPAPVAVKPAAVTTAGAPVSDPARMDHS